MGETIAPVCLTSSHFSHQGYGFSHLGYDLLHLHTMNPTMNRQEHKTTLTDPSSMMIRPQLNNLILTPYLKPEVTSHNQSRPIFIFSNSLSSPLSVEDRPKLTNNLELLRSTSSSIAPSVLHSRLLLQLD